VKHQFQKHYTREEASALLPQVKVWLVQLVDLRDRLARFEKRIEEIMGPGHDVGGEAVHGWLRALADFRNVVGEFQQREIQIKDLDRGLIDFPAILDGREVYLCWEQGEDDVEYWHELDSGYAGREPLSGGA